MANFDDFWKTLTTGLEELALKNWKEVKGAAVSDGRAFLDKTKADLERWTKLLGMGALTKDDFEWLVAGKKDLAEMQALEKAGLTLVRAERFQNALISLVIDTAFDTFA
ncbi:MAG: hypothetical protein GY850_29200 [bacterium]|nr:hypothetical protein [bacterium]